ncbi:MAG: transposase family protein [Alphaproteobacteria bacterium]|nr:MAG: transposase family protein [Alphaproteobacteria bacterium]
MNKSKEKSIQSSTQLKRFMRNTRSVIKTFLSYRRYINAGRDIDKLIPKKVGRKYKSTIAYMPEVLDTIKLYRKTGHNKFEISSFVYKDHSVAISPSSIYRITRHLGINKLNPRLKEAKRRIIKMYAGEMGHIDVHHVTKGTVKDVGNKKLYIVGLLDSYSRVCWLEVVDSVKSIDVMFSSLDCLLKLKQRYDITFKEILSDNGAEFSSKNNIQHPFERMLKFYDIKHRYTKPCRPQTNGKIERFWKTLEDELLQDETFETLQEFKEHILGYTLYYNEHRMHQGIHLKTPKEMLVS